ncbi:hypothetical protein [Mycolicibacter virginiensis]|uniref:hypothetical protein n=1 Tax=Mycolicibacter virginiensis TaxID=1795032 RepID=UPI001F03EDC1|nr:hypothetical protein [Mycolicibacter virginiensis]ULP45915.1 hypothetical protein MJO54_13650 [Mycolicibacter virginiensis]
MDAPTRAQIHRFVVTPLAPAGATGEQLDAATDALLERAPLATWSCDGHWYSTDEVTFEELQRIVNEVVGG